jgi:DHA1 family multidrug resistance protein-like MFS transporter
VLGLVGTTLGFTGLRVLQGIASAGIAAPAFALAADLAAAGSEGQQMSLVTMGFGLGIALGPLIAGLLSPVFFELPFIAGGLLSLAGAWTVYRYVPETVESQ